MLFTLLSTLPFAFFAAADLTTSIWQPQWTLADWPSTISTLTPGYYGSIINVSNDRTTLALRYDDQTDPSTTLRRPEDTWTITVGPSYYEIVNSVDNRMVAGAVNLTRSLLCTTSSEGAAIACTQVKTGEKAFSSLCSRGAYTGPAPIVTKSSIQYISGYPPFCLTDTTVPIEYLEETYTVGQSSLTTSSFKVVVTAGEEKLSATTGAVPTNTGASATGGASTGSGTTGAGPMKTTAPLLAGMGAAMAVFVL